MILLNYNSRFAVFITAWYSSQVSDTCVWWATTRLQQAEHVTVNECQDA